jgi:hypothetical protein
MDNLDHLTQTFQQPVTIHGNSNNVGISVRFNDKGMLIHHLNIPSVLHLQDHLTDQQISLSGSGFISAQATKRTGSCPMVIGMRLPDWYLGSRTSNTA